MQFLVIWFSILTSLHVSGLKARFLTKNQHTQREKVLENPLMNYGLSKSAKIVLSKSIFNFKNQLNFLKRNLGLGQIYWPKD